MDKVEEYGATWITWDEIVMIIVIVFFPIVFALMLCISVYAVRPGIPNLGDSFICASVPAGPEKNFLSLTCFQMV